MCLQLHKVFDKKSFIHQEQFIKYYKKSYLVNPLEVLDRPSLVINDGG